MSTVHIGRMNALVALSQRRAAAAVAVLVALLFSLPFVAPVHRYPLTTFDSELISAGILAVAMVVAAIAGRARMSVGWPLPTITLLLVGFAAAQYMLGMLHYTFSFTSLLLYLCAFFSAYLLGRWLVASDRRARAVQAICVGLVIGGLLSVVVQFLQVLDVQALPTWLVFPSMGKNSARRPFGNLAQPNHLATYLIWATVAAMYLLRGPALKGPLLAAAGALLLGLALTGSRMGSLFGLLLLGLALTRNALSPGPLRDRARLAIVLAVGYAIGLIMTRYLLVDATGTMATAVERYAEGSFGQRLSMWSDALRIAGEYPWLGVGVGEYGGAQYLLARPDPDLLATNNPHNLILHIAAEVGVPVALAIVVIVGWWCWQRTSAWTRDSAGLTALVLILFLLAHSMLEYPLWHLHFLVAMALLVGVAEPAGSARAARHVRSRLIFAPIGVAALCAVFVMNDDYDAIAPVWQDYLQDQRGARPHGPEMIAVIVGLKDVTYFKPQMERLYVDLFPVAHQQGAENLEVSARVLTRLGDVEVIRRHIELLLQAGRIEETYPHIARLKVFAGPYYPIVREQIEQAIAQNGAALDPFRRQLAEP